MLADAIARATRRNDRRMLARGLLFRASWEIDDGNYATAERTASEALQIGRAMRDDEAIADSLEYLAIASWSTRRLDRAGWLGDPTGDPELAIGPDGRALLEFHDARRVRLAEAPPGKPFGHARVLAHGGEPGGVAVRDDGLTLASWVAGGHVRAKLGDGRAATLSWNVGFLPEPPRAGFDADGHPVVSWDRYTVTAG
jgi:hypothetical protein